MFKRIIFLCLITVVFPEDFSDGPYGTGYFDIAGPFQVPDLNMSLQGDANIDGIINIQDIILIVAQILGNYNFNDEQFGQADINNDGLVDILDIVGVVDKILNPQDPLWNFEDQWTGNDSYIFIQYDTSVGTSTALWLSNTKEEFLEISPLNVHYFFISNRSLYESDMEYVKSSFDDILINLSEDEREHWQTHLHFINEKSSNLNNWLSDGRLSALSTSNPILVSCSKRFFSLKLVFK